MIPIADCGGAGGGDLHRAGLRPEGRGGEAAQPRAGKCHRLDDFSR